MHCPNCGNESGLDQKFCRQCGFNLEPVGKLMGSDGSVTEPQLTKVERDKLLMQRMVSWMIWGFLILLLGVVFTVIDKEFAISRLISLLGSILILGGVSVAMYGILDTLRGGAPNKALRSPPRADELQAPTTRELEGGHVPAPSVTERTTQLIDKKS